MVFGGKTCIDYFTLVYIRIVPPASPRKTKSLIVYTTNKNIL